MATNTLIYGSPQSLSAADPTEPYLWAFPVKPKKVYIAASLHGHTKALQLALRLHQAGLHITSRWLLVDFPSLPQEKLSKPWVEYEMKMNDVDRMDVREADTVVALMDPPSSSGGTHFEVGYFMGMGRTNVLAVGVRPNVFYWDEHVRFMPTVDDVPWFLMSGMHGSQPIKEYF